MRAPPRQHGFTLIELVVTLVISTIVVAFVSLFISGPVQGFADQARRVRLVDAADAALERIGRDVRRSLPNSVRTTSSGGVVALEILSTVDGARYRAQPPGSDRADSRLRGGGRLVGTCSGRSRKSRSRSARRATISPSTTSACRAPTPTRSRTSSRRTARRSRSRPTARPARIASRWIRRSGSRTRRRRSACSSSTAR